MSDHTETNTGKLTLLDSTASQLTLTEMRSTPAGEDVNEDGAVFALPALPGLVQSPGITVNQLFADSFSPASL